MASTFPGYPAFAYPASFAPYVPAPGQPAPVPFPAQFPPPGYPLLYGLPPPKPPTTTNQLPVAPDIPGISPEIASDQIQKLIVSHLKHATQFGAIQPKALLRLEQEVVAFVLRLFEWAHECANLANRANPVAKDLLMACDEQGVTVNDLHAIIVKPKPAGPSIETLFERPPPRTRSPELLPSDDEGTTPSIPTTLRQIPSNFPPLPPKHTYLKTPASPPKKAALPSLERKLKTASLVQESLKNLLTATEDNFGQEDGELLGHIVNWEASTYPRKRWKVSAV
ncbi:hypothetical protein V8B97DRAFT_2002048 [Scleroderma yunnanense]